MTVYINQLTPGNAAVATYATGQVLARQAVAHFGAVRGAGVGIGPGSCCASYSVPTSLNYPALPGLAHGATFGNSQIAGNGLDQGVLGGHAERCAITAAAGMGQLNPGVLFVELAPCAHCANWLDGNGGGVANPHNFANVAGPHLYVWYAFPYTAIGVGQMVAFHQTTLAAQNLTAAGW